MKCVGGRFRKAFAMQNDAGGDADRFRSPGQSVRVHWFPKALVEGYLALELRRDSEYACDRSIAPSRPGVGRRLL